MKPIFFASIYDHLFMSGLHILKQLSGEKLDLYISGTVGGIYWVCLFWDRLVLFVSGVIHHWNLGLNRNSSKLRCKFDL